MIVPQQGQTYFLEEDLLAVLIFGTLLLNNSKAACPLYCEAIHAADSSVNLVVDQP
jgi:hypothetical protein